MDVFYYLWAYYDHGHVAIPVGSYVYLLGGEFPTRLNGGGDCFTTIFRYNLNSKKWDYLGNTQLGQSLKLSCCYTTFAQLGKTVLIFGCSREVGTLYAGNDMISVNIETGLTKQVDFTGPCPPASLARAGTFDQKNKILYVFGGKTEHGNHEIFGFNCLTKTWAIQESSNKLYNEVYAHCLCYYNQKIYVVGGRTRRKMLSLSVLYCYKFAKKRWINVTTKRDPVTKLFPEVRYGHVGFLAMSCDGNPRYIFSGGVVQNGAANDSWSLDLITLTWSKFKTPMPEHMYLHSSVLSPSGKKVIIKRDELVIADSGDVKLYSLAPISTVQVVPPSLRRCAFDVLERMYPRINSMTEKELEERKIPSKLFQVARPFGNE